MIILILIALGFIALSFIASALIIIDLNKWGVKVQYTWFNIKIIYYAHQYLKITKLETGKIGIWYYLWAGSLIGALVCFTAYSFTN